jgi:hypothetical protein
VYASYDAMGEKSNNIDFVIYIGKVNNTITNIQTVDINNLSFDWNINNIYYKASECGGKFW